MSAAEIPPGGELAARPGMLVSLHYLMAALRRRRMLVAVSAVAGMLLGVLFLVVAPSSHTATATLVLSHDTGVDPARAMSTDSSLLTSRTIAERTISRLGLSMTADALQKTLTSNPATSDVLVLSMTGPTDAEAVRRLAAFCAVYLEFRGTQVNAQGTALVAGYRNQISSLQTQVEQLNKKLAELSAQGDNGSGEAANLLSQRAQLTNQIGSLQDSVEQTTLRSAAITAASRVIDPAAVKQGGAKLRIALALVSGLVGGLALGAGGVLFRAVLSDRLRLRAEVVAATGAPVRLSSGPLGRPGRWRRLTGFLPWQRARQRRRQRDLLRLGNLIERSLPPAGPAGRLALVSLDDARHVRQALAFAAVGLVSRGRTVHLVDLSEAGGLDAEVARARRRAGNTDGLTVERPEDVPSLATDPAAAGGAEAGRPAAGITVVLADADPAIGADHVRVWASRALLTVTSGLSGVEKVRTAGDLLRAAGLDLHGVVLLRAEADDVTSGLTEDDLPADGPAPQDDRISDSPPQGGPHDDLRPENWRGGGTGGPVPPAPDGEPAAGPAASPASVATGVGEPNGQPQNGQPQNGQPQNGQPQNGQPQNGQRGRGNGRRPDRRPSANAGKRP